MPTVMNHEIKPEDITLSMAEVVDGLEVITDPEHARLQDGFQKFGKQVGHEATRLLSDRTAANVVAASLAIWGSLKPFIGNDPWGDDYQIHFAGGALLGHLEEVESERLAA